MAGAIGQDTGAVECLNQFDGDVTSVESSGASLMLK